jgi:PAS domain S-box-containing protein
MPSTPNLLEDIFPGDSAMSAAMRSFDWESTPLGAPQCWPEGLKIPVRMMLLSRFEMWLGWGTELTFFYNDAYIPTLGAKHPGALGRPMRRVWNEVFADVEDRITSVMRDSVATWDKALLLVLERNGYKEETYHTFSYSPLRGDTGLTEGLICVVTEETERVIGERRLETLSTLASSLLAIRTREEIKFHAEQAIQSNGHDFPFAVIRLFAPSLQDEEKRIANIAGLELVDWPVASVLQGMPSQRIALADFVDDPPKGAWQVPPSQALIVPIRKTGQQRPSGALILGLNPYRPNDPEIAGFAQLLAAQIAGVLATVDARINEASEMDRLRQLFEQSPSFMAILRGPDHRFELTNPAYSQLVAHRNVIGMNVREAIPEVEGQGFFELLDTVYRTGEPFVGRSAPINIQRTPGGAPEERFLDFVYQPIRDRDGVVSGIFVEGIDVTSTRDALVALQESEAQFRTFAQAMPNQVWTSLPNGELDWFNDQVFAFSGMNFAQLAGQGWTTIIHPEDFENAARAWAAALASGNVYEVEFRIRSADGSYRWHLARALPLRDSTGKIIRWIGTNTDIHERKLSEVRSTRDRDRIWALSPVLKVVGTPAGDILAVNPTWTRVLGWSQEETVGHNIMEFVAPEDREVGAAGMADLAAGIPVVEYQNTFVTKIGERRRIAWTTVPEDGTLYGFGRDVTVEVRSALALAASTAERERIWNSTNDLMGTASLGGVLRSVNPAWKRLLGYDDEELLSRPFLDFIDPLDHQKVESAIERLKAGYAVNDLEDRLVHKDGGKSLIAWSAEPFSDSFYIVGRNVTQQRAAEDALRQSQKMEAVGQLTGGIAHDFNNLLQGITGSLDLIQRRISQGRLKELDRYVTGAMTAANRAAALTHRLLAFSRRQPLDPRPVRVNPLVASMEDLLRRTLGERIELELVLAGDLWLTLCDPNQLENAILNLAINARDAMPDGGKLIIETANAHLDSAYVAREQDIRPGQYVCVAVTDTGTGMSAETIARAFEPFFTTKPIGQGTGLGLSMIYGFARQSEGYAKIYSELGQGSTFRLYLPRHQAEMEVDHGLPDATDARVAAAGEVVLVVEDEPIVRGLIVDVLSELGYSALEAADGLKGLEILRSSRDIDLLITDVGLPGLNGRQMADAGRALRPGLKILFMTGYAENATIASGFLEPGMTMIAKPFAIEAFATRIREIIGNKN